MIVIDEPYSGVSLSLNMAGKRDLILPHEFPVFVRFLHAMVGFDSDILFSSICENDSHLTVFSFCVC